MSASLYVMLEKIDLLKYHKKRHRKKKIAAISATIVFLIMSALFSSYKFFYWSREVNTQTGFFRTLSRLILSPDRIFARDKNQINVLILGIGGAGHEGPNLTDTMLITSLNRKEKKAAMISIPRDLLVDTNRFGKQKINGLNALVEAEEPGAGANFVRRIVEEITAANIDHYVRLDFSAFEKIIDAAGGLDIDVPRTFTDPLFPRISDPAQTTTVTFSAGIQHMDGRTALIYARSRHGNNGEGNDFARSRRQQQIMMAAKKKILSAGTLFNPGAIKNILETLAADIKTDLSAWDILGLAKLYKELDISPENIATHVLTNGPDGPLYADYYNNQYVLLPKKSDWSDIRAIASDPYNTAARDYAGEYKNPSGVTLAVLNGSDVAGLASGVAMSLNDFGYRVAAVGSAPEKNFEKNVIYNLAGEDKKAALIDIRKILNANLAPAVPEWVSAAIPLGTKPDFVIIVGAKKI